MSIFVVGINHKTSPIHMRERIYFAPDKLALYLQDMINNGHAEEAVLLSTCNRSELYCEAPDSQTVKEWFCAQTTLNSEELDGVIYVHQNEAAIAHIMQVACGIDSMILGEPQIFGQMKAAFSESCAAGAIGASFNHLFKKVFEAAKMIRTTTAIGACPVSVASATLHYVKEKVALNAANIVVVGAGDTSSLLLKYLQSAGAQQVTLVNRSLEKASHLLEGFTGQILGLQHLPIALAKADVVFTATGSITPIITSQMVNAAMADRGAQPLWLIDVAVPRDIEARVDSIANVQLTCIDDLKEIIKHHHQGREHAAKKAREMIQTYSRELILELSSRDQISQAIRTYRGQIEEICRQELIKAKRRLHQGAEPMLVLDAFAHAFTKKLLHAPSVQLRNAHAERRDELLRVAKQLFAVPGFEIEHI